MVKSAGPPSQHQELKQATHETPHGIPTPAPAIVAGLDLNGLGVVRSLGRMGVPVIAIDTDVGKATARTRFGRKLRVRSLSGTDFIDGLLGLREQFTTSPVLILTHEASVATVSRERQRLDKAYRFTMPSQDLVETLLSKVRFQELAERCGFPVPRAARVSDAASAELLRQLRYPCVVKPATKIENPKVKLSKAYKVSGYPEANSLWCTLRDHTNEVIVQEWIEGGDSDIYFCLQYRPRGGGSLSFVGRKTCQWPPLVGGTATCMPAPEAAAELTALTDRFFARVGFAGLCSMEYKRDTRDGNYYMVEPTVCRTDFQEELATLNGVNIPYAAYLSETGQTIPEMPVPQWSRAWRDPFGHANALKSGAQDPVRKIAPQATICDAYFRITDPMPYLALKLEAAQRRLSRI